MYFFDSLITSSNIIDFQINSKDFKRCQTLSGFQTNLSDTFIGAIWKFLWVLLEEEGRGVQRYTNTTCQ